jgi:hypothetical protein
MRDILQDIQLGRNAGTEVRQQKEGLLPTGASWACFAGW